MLDAEFVFDLDDTLYREKSYVVSAFNFVAQVVETLYHVNDCKARLLNSFAAGDADPIETLWRREGLPLNGKKDVVAAMRAHMPSITLDQGAAELLRILRGEGRGFSIVTDGRSVTQRAKLAALGCLDAKVISISEEVGLAKVSLDRFRPIERLFPSNRYFYIGDNPAKDFIAPNKLGWTTIMLADDGTNIHPKINPSEDGMEAHYTVQSLTEVRDLL